MNKNKNKKYFIFSPFYDSLKNITKNIFNKEAALSKEIIKNMNTDINNISVFLEKLKKISNKENPNDFIDFLIENNILDDIQEINDILKTINQSLDSFKSKELT